MFENIIEQTKKYIAWCNQMNFKPSDSMALRIYCIVK